MMVITVTQTHLMGPYLIANRSNAQQCVAAPNCETMCLFSLSFQGGGLKEKKRHDGRNKTEHSSRGCHDETYYINPGCA